MAAHGPSYDGCMPTLAASLPSSHPPAPGLRGQAVLAGLVLAGFTAFSLWVVWTAGASGFVATVRHEPWALQFLIDLVIGLCVAMVWLRADARARGLTYWPYLVATVLLGSIGVLAYLVRRGFAGSPRSAPARTA